MLNRIDSLDSIAGQKIIMASTITYYNYKRIAVTQVYRLISKLLIGV